MNATIKCLNLSAKVLLIVMSAVTCVAQTHQTPNQPGPPPQVKQTVESRHWILGGLYDHVLARDKTGAIPLGNDLQSGGPRFRCGLLDERDSFDWTD